MFEGTSRGPRLDSLFTCMCSCVWTAPVDPERGYLPSPEEMKGKILVKVCIHVTYGELALTYLL